MSFGTRIMQALKNSPNYKAYGLGGCNQLANDLSVSAECVRKWASNETRPRPRMLTALAKALDVDEIWLDKGIDLSSNSIADNTNTELFSFCTYALSNRHTVLLKDLDTKENKITLRKQHTNTLFQVIPLAQGLATNGTITDADVERVVAVEWNSPTYFKFYSVPKHSGATVRITEKGKKYFIKGEELSEFELQEIV